MKEKIKITKLEKSDIPIIHELLLEQFGAEAWTINQLES